MVNGSNVTVKIDGGLVNGRIVNFHNKSFNVFTGIRYGKPPTEELRFKKPEKVENWTGIYDATSIKNKYSCWQPPNFTVLGIEKDDMNEDCLFLNVWTPNVHTNGTKSVMFFIHGGGFQYGSSLHGVLDYDAIALSLYDVVVVTINYRLGVFGFLYGENEEAPGNVGLYDQLLALNWVKRNIHAFGGDPNDITIFGQSAGSMSVGQHIVSPLSKGLFKRAILESGAPIDQISFKLTNESLDQALKYKETFCSNQTNWLKCLKNVKPIDLVSANDAQFFPVVGEKFYPIDSVEALKSGKFNSAIDIMAGACANEGTALFVIEDIFGNLTGKALLERTKIALNGVLQSNKKLSPIEKNNARIKIINDYFPNANESSGLNETNHLSDDEIKYRAGQLFGDFVLTCPTYFMSKEIALWSNENHVYLYSFNYTSIASRQVFPKWVGVTHGAELPFLFGAPLKLPHNFTTEEYQFSLLTMNLWTNFAKTG